MKKKMYEKKCMKMYEKKNVTKMYESRTSRRGTTAIAPASTTLLTGLTLP